MIFSFAFNRQVDGRVGIEGITVIIREICGAFFWDYSGTAILRIDGNRVLLGPIRQMRSFRNWYSVHPVIDKPE